MSLTEALRLLITADTAGAVHGIEKVGVASKAADKHVKSSQASLDKWGRGLTTAGAGMAAFGGVALVGLAHAAKASEEANLSTVKLKNTIANMPKLAGENSKQFTDLAQKIQGYTAADGDAIVAGEAMLGTFNLTAKQIKDITPLVVDYSRKFGVDMVSAAAQVGKALDGNVGALKRNGVSIDETMFKTDRYGAVQKALRQQVGGFARAEGATFAGSLERMKNQLGDLEEGVGAGAVDAFTTLFGAVGKVAGAMESISPGTQSAIGKFATFGSVALVAAGGMSFLIGQAIKMRANFAVAAEGISNLTGKLGGLKTVAGVAGGVAAIGALVLEAKHLGDEADKLNVSKITAALNSVSESGNKAALQMVKVSLAFNHGERDIRSIAVASVPAAREFVRMAESLGAPESLIRKLNKAIAEKKAEDIGATSAQRDYNTEVENAAGALEGEAAATTAAKDALQEYEDELHALLDPLFGMQDALQDNAKAQGDVVAKQLEATAAERAYLVAVKKHGPNSKEAAAASLNLMAAQQALTDANRGAVRSAENVDTAIAELRAEIKKNPAALDQAKAKLRQWQAQGLITGAQAKATGREFDGLAGSIRKTPSSKRVNVSTRGTEAAQQAIRRVHNEVNSLPSNKQVHVAVVATGMAQISIMEAKLLRFGSGGTVPGPIGKERVIVAHGGEEIIPRHDKAAMARYRPQSFGRPAMAGASTVNNYFNVDMSGAIVSSKADAQRWVADAWNRAASARMVNIKGRPL